MRTTRTYTGYFGVAQVAPLVALLDGLQADWDARTPHIDRDVAQEGAERIAAVKLAVARLTDRVVE